MDKEKLKIYGADCDALMLTMSLMPAFKSINERV